MHNVRASDRCLYNEFECSFLKSVNKFSFTLLGINFNFNMIFQYDAFHFYRNVFTNVCQKFCKQRGGVSLSACWDTLPPQSDQRVCIPTFTEAHTPWADTPQADPPVRPPPWADTPWETPPGRHPLGRHPPPPDGHCSGRYATYWNAFLYSCSFPLL